VTVQQNVPPNANDNIDLSTIVEVLSDDPDINYPSDVFPTSGRVVKHPVTGDIYLGDGSQFHNVSSDVGVDTPALATDKLVIGGTLYEEDDRSPIESFDFGNQVSLANPAPEVLLLPSPDAESLYGIQANGDTGNNYDNVNNDGTTSTGSSSFGIETGDAPPIKLRVGGVGGSSSLGLNYTVFPGGAVADATVYGVNMNITNEVTSVTMQPYSSPTGHYRVYRRDMS
jgi:hypothetical protein